MLSVLSCVNDVAIEDNKYFFREAFQLIMKCTFSSRPTYVSLSSLKTYFLIYMFKLNVT